MTFRWNDEALAAFEKRAQGWKKTEGNVTTHRIERPENGRPSKKSDLEVDMALQLRVSGYQFVQQHQPLLPRKWTLDFSIPEQKIGIEVQGGVHRIKDKFKRDIEKRAELMLAGWKVLEVDADSIRDGRALEWTKRLLEAA